jgi:hypothetical protein
MTLRQTCTLASVLLVLSLPGFAALTVQYNQAWDQGGIYYSQNDPNSLGLYAQVFDNFTLTNSASITTVGWYGGYYNPAIQGTLQAVTIGFYADNNGQPGAQLFSQVTLGTAHEALVCLCNGVLDYSYWLTLNAPFGVAAGTQYWLSIVGTVPLPPQWGWGTSHAADDSAYDNFEGTLIPIPSDLAFTLYSGASAPEPSSLILLASAAITSITSIRKRTR